MSELEFDADICEKKNELFELRRDLLKKFLDGKINYERLVGETQKGVKATNKRGSYCNDFLARLYAEYLTSLNLLERRVEVETKLAPVNLSCGESFVRVCEYHLKKMSSVVENIIRVSGDNAIEKVFLWEKEIGVIQVKGSPIGKLFANRYVLFEMAPHLQRGTISSKYIDLTFGFIFQKKQLDLR